MLEHALYDLRSYDRAMVLALMTLPIGPAEWIILDTSIVRSVIAAEEV